jgi:hypothetical protein
LKYQYIAQSQISSLQQHLNRNPQQLTVVILLSKLSRTGDHFTIKQNSKRNNVWKSQQVNKLQKLCITYKHEQLLSLLFIYLACRCIYRNMHWALKVLLSSKSALNTFHHLAVQSTCAQKRVCSHVKC